MHIICPHCQNPIELVETPPPQEVVCPSCGSSFHLAPGSTTPWGAGGKKTLGKFTLLETVGTGAFGTVYKARDRELDRVVAIKVPRAGNLVSGDHRDRFIREARSVAQLRHPSIVSVHEVGEVDGLPYLVSDFVQGVTLADLLSARRPGFRETAELIAALADALQHAHDQGVIHRDVKPSNIMLESVSVGECERDQSGAIAPTLSPSHSPTVRLMDFGLAKRDAGEITMTIEGQVLGTPAYMSPEQARGEGHQVDGRSDVYSLGVILYQLLTGELPFRGTQRMLLHQVLHDEPRSPRRLNDHIPRDLETICLKAMATEPGRRYITARSLADDLRRWMQGEPILARPVGSIGRLARWCRRKPLVAGLTAAVAFLLVAGTTVATYFAIDASLARDRADAKAKEALENARKEADERKRADREADAAWANQYIAHANRMESDWESANVGRIFDTLEIYLQPPPGRKDLRGWEWRYQNRLCSQELRTLKGHTSEVWSVAFSPDGARLASASDDRTVKLWDAATGQELRTLTGHTNRIRSVAFSPDGARLASASGDGTVKLWDAATGQELRTLKGHTDEVWSVAFSPDEARLASASHDRTVKLWDAATGEELHTLKAHTGWVRSVAFSPDGARLASASYDQTVKLWDAITGQELRTLKGHSGLVSSVAFSPDGARLASASEDQTVKLWDAATGQQLRTLKGHTHRVESVGFSPDGARLASASRDLTVKLWDAATGQELRTLNGHTNWVESVAFSPDGTWLASACLDQTVKLWDTATGQMLRTLKGHTSPVLSVAFSPDGARLASASADQTVKLWDAATGQELRTLKGHTIGVWSVAFSPDGARLASASHDQTVKLWDAATAQELRTLKGHTNWVDSVAFSPDGARLASASFDQTVKLWDAATGQELRTFKGHSGTVTSVAFSPDGARLASASWDGTVKLWDAITGQELRTLKGHTNWVDNVAFRPDGTRLASASLDQTVKLWDAATGQELRTLKGHTDAVLRLTFSPDGARVASASQDQTVKLWDAATGQELRTLKAHTNPVRSVAFSPDGARLASASEDQTVKLWDARPLTPEVKTEIEAVALLQILFAKPLSQAEVRAALQRDKVISAACRQKALKLAELFKEETDPQKYRAAAWTVIRHPYSNVFMCQLALAQMTAARERAPNDGEYCIGLGVAQYRLGKFQRQHYAEALATLSKCDRNHPTPLAFLAMAEQRLGEKDKAQAALQRLRETMKKPEWAKNEAAQGSLREAEMLIEAKPGEK